MSPQNTALMTQPSTLYDSNCAPDVEFVFVFMYMYLLFRSLSIFFF